MNGQQHDKAFFSSVTAVLGVLIGITLGIMLIARVITPKSDDAAALKRVEERIRPVAQVITDPSVLMKMAAPAQARAPYTGAEVVAKVCSACHQSGVLGAPKIGDAGAWGKRKSAAGGLEGLVKSATAGKNAMPPRGGDATLSDAEIKAAITQMLKSSGL